MSDKSASNVAKVLAFLAALYPKFTLTKATVQAYSQVLGDIPADLLQAAAKDLGSRSTFFPAAAELRRAAFDLQERASNVPSGYEAWEQVKAQFQGRAVEMHPMTVKAIDQLGGLAAFGRSSISEEPSWRARFVEAYDTLALRERRDREMLPQITGYVQQQLAANRDGKTPTAAIENLASKMRNGNE